jgi:hypothetical protein
MKNRGAANQQADWGGEKRRQGERDRDSDSDRERDRALNRFFLARGASHA